MKKKYKLVKKIGQIIATCGLSLAIATFSTPKESEVIPYTNEDINNNIVFSSELTEIMNASEIIFQNKEIYYLLIDTVGSPLTKEKLDSITELVITDELTNNDLSDLKFLPNLMDLSISNNTINLEDIKYNQNLYFLNLINCTIKNSDSIPNSTTTIIMAYSKCTDNRFTIPYYCDTLFLQGNSFNNLTLKNPASLTYLSIIGDAIIDLNSIANCTNLKDLSLYYCSNISNPSVLTQLPSLKELNLDDYCPIWLTNEILSKLPISEEDKLIYSEEITKLDKIASELVINYDTVPDEYKIQYITLYILEKLNYDSDIFYEENKYKIDEYNISPIKNALNSDEGICINYACLFKALANRVKLDSYQLYNEDHTWNIVVEDGLLKGYDLTNLDNGPITNIEDQKAYIIKDATTEEIISNGMGSILYYYEFDPDNFELTSNNYPVPTDTNITNIGYINDYSATKKMAEEERNIIIKFKFAIAISCINLLNSAISEKKKSKKLAKIDTSK